MRFAILMLLLVPRLALAQERLTLDEAVALGVARNRQVQVAELDVRRKENAAAAARTYRAPQFRLDLLELRLFTDSSFTFPPGAFGVFPQIGPVPPTTSDVPLGRQLSSIVFGAVSQPITQLHRIGLGVNLAGTEIAFAREQLRLQQGTVAVEIRRAYYQLLQAESGLAATREAVTAYRELVRAAGDGVQQEAVLKADLLEAQTGLAKAELDELSLQHTRATLQERLNALIGRELDAAIVPVAPPDETAMPLDLEAARGRALEQRAELRQARIKVEQAELDRRMKKAEYIPDVALSVVYLSPFNVDVLPKNVAGAGVTVRWDVFDWGRKRQELASRTAQVSQARLGLDEARAQVLVEVGHLFRRLQEAQGQLRVAALGRDTAAERLRVARNQFAAQAIALKDLLPIQARNAEALYKYREAVSGYWTARADLERAIGER